MSDGKIIAVIGATGAQGGGLCEAILNDSKGGFRCRAITRDPGKDKADRSVSLMGVSQPCRYLHRGA